MHQESKEEGLSLPGNLLWSIPTSALQKIHKYSAWMKNQVSEIGKARDASQGNNEIELSLLSSSSSSVSFPHAQARELLTGGHSDGSDPALTHLDSAGEVISSLIHYRIDYCSIELSLTDPPRARGGFSDVFQANLFDRGAHREVALKRPRIYGSSTPPQVLRRTARELSFLSTLKHPNIIELVGFVEDASKGIPWLLFPWMKNGNVREFLHAGLWEVPERISLLSDLASGIEYLHSRSQPIVHGDLKSANILVNDEHRAVITDFGLARPVGVTTSSSPKGKSLSGPGFTTRWVAPEVLTETSPSLTSDIWSFGWVTWEILTDRLPFEEIKEDSEVLDAILQGNVPSTSEDARVSAMPGLSRLMTECWSANPMKRPSATKCRATLVKMPQIVPTHDELQNGTRIRSADRLRAIGDTHVRGFRISEGLHYIGDALEISRTNCDTIEIASALLSLGRVYCIQCEYSKADQAFSEAKELHAHLKQPLGLAQALYWLGHVYCLQGECDRAKVSLVEANEINVRIGNDVGTAETIYGLAELHKRRGELSKAQASYIEAQKIHSRAENELGVVETVCGLADVQRMQCQFDQAESAYLDAASLYEQLGDSLGISRTQCGLGDIYVRKSMHGKAEKLYREARDIAQQVGHPLGEANALCGLGHSHRLQRQYAEAASCFQEAGDTHARIGNSLGVAETTCGMGDTHRMRSEYSNAEVAYNQARDLYNQVGHHLGVADGGCGLGFVRLAQGRSTEAESLFNEAVGFYQKEKYEVGVANATFGLAAVHLTRLEYSSAFSRLQKALETYTLVGIPGLRASGLLLVALVYEAKHQNDEAMHSIEEAISIYSGIGDGSGVSACRKVRRRIRDSIVMAACFEIVDLYS